MENINNIKSNLTQIGNNVLNETEDVKTNLKEAYEWLFVIPEKQDVGISTTGKVKEGDDINAFAFLITEDESIQLNSNITDYVLENNTMAQSGNTRQPIKVEISGIVGELFYEKPQDTLKGQSFIQQKLNKFAGISPSLSIKGQEYLNKVNQAVNKINDVVDKVDNAFAFIKDFTAEQGLTLQQQAFQILSSMWRAGETFRVSTYYGQLNNMLIESCKIQQGDNLWQSKINLTLKQITFAKTQTRQLKESDTRKVQASEKQNNGTQLISKASGILGIGA